MSAPIAGPVNRWGYRPHLDGMRAIAVYLVVLFHSGAHQFQGGFVGVDLFFVLSGFLVTNVVLADASKGGIRFGRFYARRARRLIPAASVAIIGVSITAFLVSSILDRANIVGDARAASLWYANWHFIASANDYFGAATLESPLLHFWSLAVEEQFYLFFPLVLFVVIRVASGRLKWVAGVFAVLLVAGAGLQVWWAGTDPNHAYLGTDARVYQPLAGVLLAIVLWQVPLSGRRQLAGNLMFGGGVLGLVLLAIVAPSWNASWRGFAAAAVAVLAILGSEMSPTGWVAKTLAWRPIRYLGAISYGTYLWHWPIVAFGHRLLEISPTAMFVFSAIGGTAFAALSYELLEQPIRNSTWLKTRSSASVAIGIVTAASVGLVFAPYILQRPTSPQVRALSGAAELTTRTPVPELDWTAAKTDFLDKPGCVEPDASDCLLRSGSGKTVFILGDSHALMWTAAILELADRYDWTVYVGFSPGCLWPKGVHLEGGAQPINVTQCIERRPRNYEQIETVDADLVVLAERGISNERAARVVTTVDAYNTFSGKRLLRRAMIDSTKTLTAEPGRSILLIEPIPEVGQDPLECLSGAQFIEECAFAPVGGTSEDSIYRELAESSPRVAELNLDSQICGEVCLPIIDGVIVRRDANHLSDSFVRGFADQFDAAIKQLDEQSAG